LEQVDFRDTPVVTMQCRNEPLAPSRKHLEVLAVRYDRGERSTTDNDGNFGSRTESTKSAAHGDKRADLLAVCLRNSLWAVEPLCCGGCTHWIDGWFLYGLKHLNAKAKDSLKTALTSGKYREMFERNLLAMRQKKTNKNVRKGRLEEAKQGKKYK